MRQLFAMSPPSVVSVVVPGGSRMMPRVSSFSLKEKPGVSRVPKHGRHSVSTIVSMRPLPAGRFGSAVDDAVLLPREL